MYDIFYGLVSTSSFDKLRHRKYSKISDDYPNHMRHTISKINTGQFPNNLLHSPKIGGNETHLEKAET